MRVGPVIIGLCGALALAACSNKAEKTADAKADAVKAEANVTATELENKADTAKDAGAKTEAKSLDEQADQTRKAADQQADAIKKQADRATDEKKDSAK